MRRTIISFLLIIAVTTLFAGSFILISKKQKMVAEAEFIDDNLEFMRKQCNVCDTNPNFGTNCERLRTEFASIEENIVYKESIAGRPLDSDGFFMDDPNYIHFQYPENVVFEINGKLVNGNGEYLGEAASIDIYNDTDIYETEDDLPYVENPHEDINDEPVPFIEETTGEDEPEDPEDIDGGEPSEDENRDLEEESEPTVEDGEEPSINEPVLPPVENKDDVTEPETTDENPEEENTNETETSENESEPNPIAKQILLIDASKKEDGE